MSIQRIIVTTALVWVSSTFAMDYLDYPEGYYPFEQAPTKNPPKVRKPPYAQSDSLCPGVLETKEVAAQSLQNLCGNLNEGYLPVNPMGQKVSGQSYPFDLIKNTTLEFFSKTLPILKEDKTLPKVAKYMQPNPYVYRRRTPSGQRRHRYKTRGSFVNRIRKKRSKSEEFPSSIGTDPDTERASLRKSRELLLNSGDLNEETKRKVLQEHFELTKAREEGRSARSFCENNYGILCIIFNSLTGRNKKSFQTASERIEHTGSLNTISEGSLRPLTPCPSAVEYVTPVFARNYQGVWRYVVQIPYEGYFTQTVEITQCLSSKCHYLSGSCLSSPRWISLLVAEIYYPDAIFPTVQNIPNFRQREVSTNLGQATATKRGQFSGRRSHIHKIDEAPQHCDGLDKIGCFQVRLYYDWFLVPGSCKCWKQDFYAQFALKT